MPAAALEMSVLESKDKATLLEMAKALGVKASTSLRKADIIDKIIASTGQGDAAPVKEAVPVNGASTGGASSAVTDRADTERADTERPDSQPSTSGSSATDRRSDEAHAGDDGEGAPSADDRPGSSARRGAARGLGT